MPTASCSPSPIAYRDERTGPAVDACTARVSREELYAVNGLQFLPFTPSTSSTPRASAGLWDTAAHVVLLPDLLAYWLTGELRTEATNASTTGLLDVRTRSVGPPTCSTASTSRRGCCLRSSRPARSSGR